MNRSKKIVVMCHCLLNSNSKIAGLAHYPGALLPVVNKHLTTGAGLLQLPCPEMTYLGLKRWGMTKDQYDTPFFRRHCRNILQPYIDQIAEYLANGYRIEQIIGVDGSPSCGVTRTCAGYCGGMIDEQNPQTAREIEGNGVFIEELSAMLRERNLSIPFAAIDENNPL